VHKNTAKKLFVLTVRNTALCEIILSLYVIMWPVITGLSDLFQSILCMCLIRLRGIFIARPHAVFSRARYRFLGILTSPKSAWS